MDDEEQSDGYAGAVSRRMVDVAQSWVDRLVGETRVAVSLEFQSTALAERLASLLEAARPMPLTRSQVRVDKRAVYRLVAELRPAVRAEETAGRIKAAVAFSILSAADDVHDAVFNARPVPLTDQVRLPRERVYDLALVLRRVVGGA
jgi:hypothetical protein